MPTLFTRIIDGEIPGTFVWKDERCVAFLTIQPLRPGHVLVVPREEIDHWIDAPQDLMAHLTTVAQTIARALHKAFPCTKVALQIAGLEVPHLHIHISPMDTMDQMNFAHAVSATPEQLAQAAQAIREELRKAGCSHVAG